MFVPIRTSSSFVGGGLLEGYIHQGYNDKNIIGKKHQVVAARETMLKSIATIACGTMSKSIAMTKSIILAYIGNELI
jgi:hypothetical protein